MRVLLQKAILRIPSTHRDVAPLPPEGRDADRDSRSILGVKHSKREATTGRQRGFRGAAALEDGRSIVPLDARLARDRYRIAGKHEGQENRASGGRERRG